MNLLKAFIKEMPITAFFLALMLITTAIAIYRISLGLMIPAMLFGLIALFAQFIDIRNMR